MLGYIAARTERLHPVHRDHADHDQRPGEDRRGLRDAAAPRRRPGGPHDGPRQHRARSTRGSARTSATASRSPWRTTRCCAGCGARTWWTGRASSAPRCRASRRRRARSTASRRSCGTARSAAPRSPSRPPTTATGSSPTTSSGPRSTPQRMIGLYRQRFEHYGHGTADQAIVGLGGQVFMRKNSQDAVKRVPAVLRQRPRLRARPVDGGLHRADAADRGQPAGGHRPDAGVPRATSVTTSGSCS